MKISSIIPGALALGILSFTTLHPTTAQQSAVVEAQPTYFDQQAVQDDHSVGHSASMGHSSYGSYDGQGCGSACGSYNTGRGRFLGQNLLSRIQPSEEGFDCFVSPITNPIYFEDPRNLTELRPVYIRHNFPAALGGGGINVYALQLRARLSENVSLIAIKDGYIESDSALLENGWADLGFGFKFNLLRDVANQRLWSAGFTYEAPTGSASALQGNGAGELNLFSSAAGRIGERGFWMAAGGVRQPLNRRQESSSLYNSIHYAHLIQPRIYAVTEFNWFRWFSSGSATALGFEGLDLINFGSEGVSGNSVVSWAYGLRFKPSRRQEIGAAYEIPLSGRRDIMGNRLTADWILRF